MATQFTKIASVMRQILNKAFAPLFVTVICQWLQVLQVFKKLRQVLQAY
jgi:hypothetical protein